VNGLPACLPSAPCRGAIASLRALCTDVDETCAAWLARPTGGEVTWNAGLLIAEVLPGCRIGRRDDVFDASDVHALRGHEERAFLFDPSSPVRLPLSHLASSMSSTLSKAG
jgi:hypothetical protein